MLPEWHRSEHGQRRELCLYNDGSQEIPAFGACEIVNVVRPDAAGTITPGGGRTQYKVKRPTAANLDSAKVLFNGPAPIAMGKEGVGFHEFPAYALYDTGSSTPSVGDALGTQADSFVLAAGSGFVAWGDIESGRLMVARQSDGGFDRCNALLKGAYSSGGSTITVDSVTATKRPSPVESASDELEVTVYFANWPDMDDNAKLKIEWNATDERWELYQADCGS